MTRVFASLAVLSFLLIYFPLSEVQGQDGTETSCQILVDWDQDWQLDDFGETKPSLVNRYKVVFDPPFTNGTSPSLVNSSVEHLRGGIEFAGQNTSILVAGGEVDIVLPEQPQFGDFISISIQSEEALCSRSLNITNWNQPIEDHEITRETGWAMSDIDGEGQGIFFEGRGWQKRTGSILESNELGNGSLYLDMTNGSSGAILDLDLDKIWLNETYDGTDLIVQDFEMTGVGNMSLDAVDGGEGATIDARIDDAFVFRSYKDGKISERMRFQGDGWLSVNGGANDSSGGAFGEVFLLYFETWDEDGFRRLQDLQVEANASVRLSAVGEFFSFDLEEMIIREKWEEGVRTDQYSRIFGSGEFDFIASEDNPFIEVNGTIPILHFQSEGGETVADTIIVDGTYDGDAQGTFGLVRQIVESGVFENASGAPFEADKIRNEFWFNVSATPFGPIDQEWGAEHNLTYEYVVPQEDWDNRTIRYTYVDDNGSEEDEFPENSPIIFNPDPPEANPVFSDHISRETGVCPQIVSTGDRFYLIGNSAMVLDVEVSEMTNEMVDGHSVSVAHWNGIFGDSSSANGSVINEGPLSGLLNQVSRQVRLEIGVGEAISFVESQEVDRIHYPSIITLDENSPPELSQEVESAVRFREGILTSEGGIAHLEVSVDDKDTDISSVSVDLSTMGLGIVELSDSGLLGDRIIHDDLWTARIVHNGLQHGVIDIEVIMQDYWVTVQQNASLQVVNPPPRMLDVEFDPVSVYRGDQVRVTVWAFDGHAIKSVSADLQALGGVLFPLDLVGDFDWVWEKDGSEVVTKVEQWSGLIDIPTSISPGRQTIPILLEDNEGASSSTSSTRNILSSSISRQSEQITISNLPPSISNLTLMRDGDVVDFVTAPISGKSINYTMELRIEDLDGISSAQAKIGRLAPIGKSESWLLLLDDGSGPDRFAGDGIYSISFSARPSLSEGEIIVMIRSTDVFLSTTPDDQQWHNISIVKSDIGPSTSSWFSENSTQLIVASIIAMLCIAIGAFVYVARNSDLEY